MKSATENVVADLVSQHHLLANIEQVEEMLRTTYHIVIKALVKFTLIGLRHDGHVHRLVKNFIQLFCILLKRFSAICGYE